MKLVLFNNCCGFLRQIIDSCSFADRTGQCFKLFFIFYISFLMFCFGI